MVDQKPTYLSLGEALEQHGHEVQYFGMEHEGRCVGNRVNAYTSGMDFHGGSKLSKLTYPIKTIYSKEAATRCLQQVPWQCTTSSIRWVERDSKVMSSTSAVSEEVGTLIKVCKRLDAGFPSSPVLARWKRKWVLRTSRTLASRKAESLEKRRRGTVLHLSF